jgi:hypothetical protein
LSNAAAAIPEPKKKRRFGRPDVVRPLAGLDMRSQEAKAFMARLTEVTAEYPNGEPGRLREIAGLRLTLEQVQVEVMNGSSRARADLVRLSNLISRREGELSTRQVVRAPAPPTIKDHLARLAARRPIVPRADDLVDNDSETDG